MACFVSGTRIFTIDGPRPVETLLPGDRLLTNCGEAKPVRWLGRRTADPYHHPWPRRVHPIRIAADTFGPSLPERPLLLAPGQPICIDIATKGVTVLVPCGLLTNGVTIAPIDIGTVTYWAIELAAHDLILAENLAVASYLEAGQRDNFEHGGAPLRLFADFSPPADPGPWSVSGCLPMVLSGPLLEAARREVPASIRDEKRAVAAG
jgi:Hint domain